MHHVSAFARRHPFVLLTLAIYLALVCNNARFFFWQPAYELGDLASDSLSIDRAKGFDELYGTYPRWGFHHPGPAFFYEKAAGEWLFFDKLHLAAAPSNGQQLSHTLLLLVFYVAALRIFTQWMPAGRRWWFACVALMLGVVHLVWIDNLLADPTVAHGEATFLYLWGAFQMAPPFLCLLAAGASVAAGCARDLPWLAFAGGMLLNGHVAQPLFVLPICLLAYGGLCRESARREGRATVSARLTAAWRGDPRPHWLAAGILAFLLSPILLDLTRGSDSNFAASLRHMRSHHGEHHPLTAALLYFVEFGLCAPYQFGEGALRQYDTAGVLGYLREHAVACALWSAVIVLACGNLAARALPRSPDRADGDAPAARRFLAWAGVFLLLASSRTLVWGIIQDGRLLYYNAWFNFAIYHFALLGAWATVCAVRGWPLPVETQGTRAALAVAVGAVCFCWAVPWRIPGPLYPYADRIRQTVQQAVAELPGPAARPSPRLLLSSQDDPMFPVGVGLFLRRAGVPLWVAPQEKVIYGANYTVPPTTVGTIQIWRVGKASAEDVRRAAAAGSRTFPLEGDLSLTVVAAPPVDLRETASGAVLDLGTQGNAAFETLGWNGAEAWGAWSDGKWAVLTFHPRSEAAGDVEVALDVIPLLAPESGLTGQRLGSFFNGSGWTASGGWNRRTRSSNS